MHAARGDETAAELQMRDRSDGELMARYAQGSQEAFEELFRRHERSVYAYFLRRVRTKARARDLYQELFLRLHRFRADYDSARPFEPWLFRIARHVLVDEWRQIHRRSEVALDEAERSSAEPDAESRAASREAVRRALADLSPEQIHILVEAKVRGREYAEIAAELAKSLDAVKQVASRSLRRLRGGVLLTE
jgi:RNA polymerase sigma-70 factor (ECF subfamily)